MTITKSVLKKKHDIFYSHKLHSNQIIIELFTLPFKTSFEDFENFTRKNLCEKKVTDKLDDHAAANFLRELVNFSRIFTSNNIYDHFDLRKIIFEIDKKN